MSDNSTLAVNFTSDPEFIIKGLISDVTATECIYDLIDNAIDAARNIILTQPHKKDAYGLPASYDGFKIEIDISSTQVSIDDNCSGIDAQTLSRKVFSIGTKSKHPFGIGHYGVGLNRAIFKLGKRAILSTDTGLEKLTLDFTETDVRNAIQGSKTINAKRHISTKQKRNLLNILDINDDVRLELDSGIWIKELINQTRIRYAIFNAKGLKITINKSPIGNFGPTIRDATFLRKANHSFLSTTGVNIYLEAGLHENYRVKGIDSDHESEKRKINELTDEYGWYVICNDRIILVADKSKITGWTTSWHNEYHGFLGWINFVSEDPSLLPWDSKKTGINTNNKAQSEAVIHLRKLAKAYRTKNRKLRKSVSESPKPHETEVNTATTNKTSQKPSASSTNSTTTTTTTINSNISSDGSNTFVPTTPSEQKNQDIPHTNNMDALILDIDTASRSPRVNSLLKEARQTSIRMHPYTSTILLRVLFEAAIRDYATRHKFYKTIKQAFFDEQHEHGRTLDTKQKNNFSPSLQQMITWTLQNNQVLPDDQRRAATLSLGKFKNDLVKINGIVHEDGVLTDYSEATQMRNNAYFALCTFLEH